MSRKSVKDIKLKTNLRCIKVYPVEETNKMVSDLKTVGIKLKKQEAIELGISLLVASQVWNEIEITGYRLNKRKSDGTYPLTVTGLNN